jgi:hypothetical protein
MAISTTDGELHIERYIKHLKACFDTGRAAKLVTYEQESAAERAMAKTTVTMAT